MKTDPRFNETTSKREMFAAMAMQGLLASGMELDPQEAAQAAVSMPTR